MMDLTLLNPAVLLLLLTLICSAEAVNFIGRLTPSNIEGLQTGQNTSVSLHVESSGRCPTPLLVSMSARCSDDTVCTVVPGQFDVTFVYNETAKACHGIPNGTRLVVVGLFLGRAQLILEPSTKQNDSISIVEPDSVFHISVYRTKTGRGLSLVFTVAMTAIFVVNNFFMGTQLDVAVLKKVIRVPVGPCIGFACQYLLMPLTAFGFGSVLLAGQSSLQFGYMALGCAPGGGQSNMWTVLLNGNIDLSMTMTFVSSVAALGMMPFWLYTLGATFYSGQISIPFLGMIGSIATLIAPAVVGLAYITQRPKHKEACNTILKLYTLTTVLIITVFGTLANLYVFELVTLKTAVTGLLLPWTGYVASYGIAAALRQTTRDCITIAIETGIQSASIAVILCKFTLPEPDSDLTMVMPLCVLIFTYVPMWLLYLAATLRRSCWPPAAEPGGLQPPGTAAPVVVHHQAGGCVVAVVGTTDSDGSDRSPNSADNMIH